MEREKGKVQGRPGEREKAMTPNRYVVYVLSLLEFSRRFYMYDPDDYRKWKMFGKSSTKWEMEVWCI